MYYKKYPFQEKNVVKLAKLLESKPQVPFPDEPQMNGEIRKLICAMLEMEEDDRIEWEDLFNHPKLQLNLEREGFNIIQHDMTPNEDLKEIEHILDLHPESIDLSREYIETKGNEILNNMNKQLKIDEIALRVIIIYFI